MKIKMYVKKIRSFHPVRYAYMPLVMAVEYYSRYVSGFRGNEETTWKNFEEWIKTEI